MFSNFKRKNKSNIDSNIPMSKKSTHFGQSKSESNGIDQSIFLGDQKIIDFVFAYRQSKMTASHAEYKNIYCAKLIKKGLILEHEGIEMSQDGKTEFVKIHAPWEVLASIAEINRVKVPIEAGDGLIDDDDDVNEKISNTAPLYQRSSKIVQFFCCKRNPCTLEADFEPPKHQIYFTLEFNRAKLEQYATKDKDSFFPQIMRIRLVWDILERTLIDSSEINNQRLVNHKASESVGLEYLLQQKVFTAVFPLHDGDTHVDLKHKSKKPKGLWPMRPWLYETWARPGRWYKYQPLDEIRNYFGEQIGIYFAWLGFYTSMLIPLAIMGLVTIIIGVVCTPFDAPMQEICFESLGNDTIICRYCQEVSCGFETLDEYCTYAVVNAIFNNYATMVFALATSLWAILFLELWKRYQARIACRWDMVDLTDEYEPPRLEYQAYAKKKRRHPITREWEPYISERSRFQKILSSAMTVSFLICIVLAIITSVIIYKIIMVTVYANAENEVIDTLGSSTFTSLTASVINAIFIIIMEKVYIRVAWGLTEKEYPRTMSDFETSYTYKMYIFQFVNYYATLFYLAFVQGYMYTTPLNSSSLTDHCSPVGCTFSVTTQLCVVLIVKQVINNVIEIGKPLIMNWINTLKNIAESEDNIYARHEKDHDLGALPALSLLPEYLEMVLQFGFVTMFGATFPIAALFALLNNIAEIRIDAYKFVVSTRRALPVRAADLGSWYNILEFVTRLAILTNALLIAYTTDVIDRFVYLSVYSEDGSLSDYLDWTLAKFNTSDWDDEKLMYWDDIDKNVTECRYKGYFYEPKSEYRYQHSPAWWRVNLWKLAFVVLFQNFIYWTQSLIQYLITDVPDDVKLHIQRNRYVSKVSAEKFEADRARSEALKEAQRQREASMRSSNTRNHPNNNHKLNNSGTTPPIKRQESNDYAEIPAYIGIENRAYIKES